MTQNRSTAVMQRRVEAHNGMTGLEQPAIPLHVFTLRIETSAPVDMTQSLRQLIAEAVWRVLPGAEDGDVFVSELMPRQPDI